jgi:hypothetical protein
MQEGETVEKRSMHRGDEKHIYRFNSQFLMGRDHLGDIGIDGKIILI